MKRVISNVLPVLLLALIAAGCPAQTIVDEIVTDPDAQVTQETLAPETAATIPCDFLNVQFISDTLAIVAEEWPFEAATAENRIQCRFKGDNGQVVTVYVDQYDSPEAAKRAMQATRTVLGGPDGGYVVTDFDEVGEKGIWAEGDFGQLFFVVGSQRVSVIMAGDIEERQAGAVNIGNQVRASL